MKKSAGIFLILFIIACSHKAFSPSGSTIISFSENAIKGQKAFIKNCNRCHPDGKAGRGPAIIKKPSFVIKFQVRNGLGAMPSFSKDDISKEELKNLVLYIKELR